jgi:hypothetical protein
VTDRYPGEVAQTPVTPSPGCAKGRRVGTTSAYRARRYLRPGHAGDTNGLPAWCSCTAKSLRCSAGEITVLRVEGEVDLCTLPNLQVALDGSFERRPAHLVVDLAGVTFAPSGGSTCLPSRPHRRREANRLQRHPVHDVDKRDDHPEPGCPRARTRPSGNNTPCSYCLTMGQSEVERESVRVARRSHRDNAKKLVTR